ncbi:MAG: YchJ family metal-binding protein [Gammaproteobacteria bacterium]|nr:YchJ family metal-binding protein [Gammaproteobacteria bacterium]
MNCPCHSGQLFDQCCGRFISHRELPENALQLMRSRYCAYVLDDAEYLSETWHPDFRPSQLTGDSGIRWIGLTIIDSAEQNMQAMVEFEARMVVDGQVQAMHEKSNFVVMQGKWFYTNGGMLAPTFQPWKPGRNEPCPCGSGKKFKRCCG